MSDNKPQSQFPVYIVSEDPGNAVCDVIPDDETMFVRQAPHAEALEHYFFCGRSALRCVRLALAAAGRGAPQKILDLPCGHGRVLRMLRAAYPQAEVHACDLLTAGVDFCAKQLGAVPIISQPDASRIPLRGPYDLIWVGSLFTHFDKSNWTKFLSRFHNELAPGGVCVFTTHGRWAADLIQRQETNYGLADAPSLLPSFRRDGFAYRAYSAKEAEYGISLSSMTWVCGRLSELTNARVILALEKGWADHQDVFAWQKLA